MQPSSISTLVRAFDDRSDGAAMKSRELVLMLLDCSPTPLSRNQFTPGHITCTGLVLAPDGESLLLVHHRRLGRWLLPGGHIEPADIEICDTARREVIEETGVTLAPADAAALTGIDVHAIPAGKGEPYHLHHDLLFALRATGTALQVSEESHAVAWCRPDQFDTYSVPENVRLAYQRLR